MLDRNIATHAEFILQCPVISAIMIAHNSYWPQNAQHLLTALINMCNEPFKVAEKEIEYRFNDKGLEFWESGHWYPHWPGLRQGLQYPDYYTAAPEPINGE